MAAIAGASETATTICDLPGGCDTIPVGMEEREHDRRPSAPLVRDDRYVIGSPIGRGGMGEVLVAHDVQIGRDVAIKKLRNDLPPHATMSRFLREARIQGRLEHPAIPPVYELGYDADGQPFFAMRKLDGVTLYDTLHDPASPFSCKRLLRAFVDVCNAIELANSRGIIHRDLKPSNILLGEHGEVYVLDWGIAREIDRAEPAAPMGTPGYMAPEQIRAIRDIDARADVYALGCVLFEIVTGKPLHPRGDQGVHSTLRGVTIEPDAMAPELAEICRRAIERKRSQRTSSAREIGNAVQCYLDGDRDEARRRELALERLAAANDALEGPGDDATRRSNAMREAGRALALDPTLPGAAELVGRIMIEPPAKLPSEVEEEHRAALEQEAAVMARISMASAVCAIAIGPVLFAFGIRDLPYLGAFVGLGFAMLITSILGVRRIAPRVTFAAFSIVVIAMIALTARMFSPFLIAPATASLTLAMGAFQPAARSRLVTLLLMVLVMIAILGVYAAEALGLVAPTMIQHGDWLYLHLRLEGASQFCMVSALCVFVIMVMPLASAGSYFSLRSARRSREQLQIQQWHLRQLIRH